MGTWRGGREGAKLVAMSLIVLFTALGATPAMARPVLILDFDGHGVTGFPVYTAMGTVHVDLTIPGYQGDWDDVLRRVREDFAPFNVDVLNSRMVIEPMRVGHGIDPDTGKWVGYGVRIVIGGSQDDIGRAVRGYDVRGTSDNESHTGLVPVVYQGQARTTQSIAQTVSHEAGHLFGWWLGDLGGYPFGLSHYGQAHDITAQGKTQILGAHAAEFPGVKRDIWWKDPDVELAAGLYGRQEDIAVLLAVLGIRPDDHPDDPELGSPMRFNLARTQLRGAGIIELNPASWPRTCAPWGDPGAVCPAARPGQTLVEEKDFFRFRVDLTGAITVRIDTINLSAGDTAANLAAEIELWRKVDGVWQALRTSGDQDPGALSAWITWQVTAGQTGDYAVGARSRGEYGDLGQYIATVTGAGINEVGTVKLDPPAETPPRVVGVQAMTQSGGRGEILSAVILTFDRAPDPKVATDLSRYRLVSSGFDRLLGTADDVPVTLKPVAYDAARRAVTLAPEKPPAASQFFRMTVSGSGLSAYSATLGGR